MSQLKIALMLALWTSLWPLADNAWAETFVSIEAAQTYQSKNDQRVPGEGGDLIVLTDFSKGPFFSNRIFIGHKWDERHEIRALYAPLEINLKGELKSPARYLGSTFAANMPTTAFYKFNSYRLTYAYHLDPTGDWRWSVGFTGKIRDAEVRLVQGALRESKTNIGFVPLLHVRGTRPLAPERTFQIDLDGLAAPQGRAFDLGLFLSRSLKNERIKIYGGYRTAEGGADNNEVYNFAWFHSATVGLTYRFSEPRGQDENL